MNGYGGIVYSEVSENVLRIDVFVFFFFVFVFFF